MILFPAIDLIGGKVVRLERGDRSPVAKVYSDDPVAVARSFAEQGASWVHVVDLSAAFGEDEDACAANSAAIKAICGVDGLSVDVGGGVRSLARIDELVGYGARRIALGTVLVTEPGFAEVAAQGFGELLVADIAARDGQVKVNGWRDGAGVALDDAVAQLTELGFKHLVYTDIARDGMQTGIDVAAYRHVAEVAGFPVVASGGISTLDDIRALAAVGEGAIEGAITGRALYEGNFTLAQALAAAEGRSSHAYQTRDSLLGRQGRPRGQGRQLCESARCGRPGGAGPRLRPRGCGRGRIFGHYRDERQPSDDHRDGGAMRPRSSLFPIPWAAAFATWRACAPWLPPVPTRCRSTRRPCAIRR